MTLDELLHRITPPDRDAARRARAHWDSRAKPLGSLGLLEDALVRIAAITGSEVRAGGDGHSRAVACGGYKYRMPYGGAGRVRGRAGGYGHFAFSWRAGCRRQACS